MTTTFLVEIVYRTQRKGGSLVRYKVEAGTNSHAYDMVREMLGLNPADIMAGWTTCDPYKVDGGLSA